MPARNRLPQKFVFAFHAKGRTQKDNVTAFSMTK